MNRIVVALIFVMLAAGIQGTTEVSGYITQDTIWSPENNPYIVTSNVYVNHGATLTILPGTEVRFHATSRIHYNPNFAASLIVHGRIVAIGTPEHPITFDKHQSNPEFRWPGIYLTANAQLSFFEYCEFRNTFYGLDEQGIRVIGAIAFACGDIHIRHCTFENNYSGIYAISPQVEIIIYGCTFISLNDIYPHPSSYTSFIGVGWWTDTIPATNYKLTVANCRFIYNSPIWSGISIPLYTDLFFLNNVFHRVSSRAEEDSSRAEEDSNDLRRVTGSFSSYGNTMIGGRGALGCRSATATDTVFARRNRFFNPADASQPSFDPRTLSSSGFGTNYVSDNYLYGNVQVHTQTANTATSFIYNNVIESHWPLSALLIESRHTQQGGQLRFFNNLVRYLGSHASTAVIVREASPYIYNNTILGYGHLNNSFGSYHTVYTNNIIDVSFSYGMFSVGFHPLLYNNCLSIPIPPGQPMDGGGNIVADPMFADILNGDFSLQAGSPCIDAGVNRPDLPEFDIRYHKRIAPGTIDGPRRVDIGAYEYNSVYIGGIDGYVYDSVSGEAVDCVRIEIMGKLPEFSDTLGFFHYPTGAGVYTVKASRWDYQDLIIPNVTVVLGEDTVLNIPLTRDDVSTNDHVQLATGIDFALRNHPNPFNPSTTVSFIHPGSGAVNLAVYNLKGQKVKTLYYGDLPQGHHSFIWDGRDESGSSVASGIFFVMIETQGRRQSHKMILMK